MIFASVRTSNLNLLFGLVCAHEEAPIVIAIVITIVIDILKSTYFDLSQTRRSSDSTGSTG